MVTNERKLTPSEALPLKAVADELAFLRKTFREVLAAYANHIEGEIVALREAVQMVTQAKRVPAGRVHDLRDMLMLLRGFKVKPAKGKRRDMKKVEVLIEELRRTVDGWE